MNTLTVWNKAYVRDKSNSSSISRVHALDLPSQHRGRWNFPIKLFLRDGLEKPNTKKQQQLFYSLHAHTDFPFPYSQGSSNGRKRWCHTHSWINCLTVLQEFDAVTFRVSGLYARNQKDLAKGCRSLRICVECCTVRMERHSEYLQYRQVVHCSANLDDQ